MTWVRLDDQFHRNKKALKMSDAAHRIYVDALSYCGSLKDLHGYLSVEEADTFVRGRKKPLAVIEELVQLGAWERVCDGYLIHDWPTYLPPRAKQRVIDWQNSKRAESTNLIDIQSVIEPRLDADYSPGIARIPIPESRSPYPVGSKEPPSVGSHDSDDCSIESRGWIGGEESTAEVLRRFNPVSQSRKETA